MFNAQEGSLPQAKKIHQSKIQKNQTKKSRNGNLEDSC